MANEVIKGRQASAFRSEPPTVVEHHYFASASADAESVTAVMDRLRGDRCHDR